MLDHSPSIGAPAGDGEVPSNFKEGAGAMGAASTGANSMGASSGTVDADDSNVAVKQTPENTPSETTETLDSGSTGEASSEEAPADATSTDQE